MENNQQILSQQAIGKRVHQNLKSLLHFSYQISLPQTVQIYEYQPKHTSQSKKKKKLKNKFQNFKYYKSHQDQIIHKVLFINQSQYVDQGLYPFIQPEGKIKKFSELNAKRLKIAEAAYIGHIGDQIVIKKIEGVKLGEKGTQFQTVNDKFQILKIGKAILQNIFRQLKTIHAIHKINVDKQQCSKYVDQSVDRLILSWQGSINYRL